MEHPALPTPEALQTAAARVGLRLTEEQVALSVLHARELQVWGRTTSLVRFDSASELIDRHLAEGWVAALLLPPAGPEPLAVLDIGSGGGIPALPMRVIRPDIRLSLVEPKARKAAFLRHVARHFPDPRPQVLECRLEDVASGQDWDVVSFRGIDLDPSAVGNRVRRGGLVLRFPGRDDARADWEAAGFRLADSRPLPTASLRCEAWRSE